jgi:hypothetical protein
MGKKPFEQQLRGRHAANLLQRSCITCKWTSLRKAVGRIVMRQISLLKHPAHHDAPYA